MGLLEKEILLRWLSSCLWVSMSFFLSLEDSFEALLSDVQELSGCSSEWPRGNKNPSAKANICCRLLPPLAGEFMGSALYHQACSFAHRLAQGLHSKLVLEDLVQVHGRRGSQPHARRGHACTPQWSSHIEDVRPTPLRLDLKHFDGAHEDPGLSKASWRHHPP